MFATLASISSWFAPALIVLLLILGSGAMRRRVALPAGVLGGLWAVAILACLFNLATFLLR